MKRRVFRRSALAALAGAFLALPFAAVSTAAPAAGRPVDLAIVGMAADMVDSLVCSPSVQRELAKRPAGDLPVVGIYPRAFENRTMRMDAPVGAVQDAVLAKFLASGLVRVLETGAEEQLLQEWKRMRAFAPPGTPVPDALPFADWRLFGSLSEIRGDAEDHFLLALRLVDVRTGLAFWAAQREVVVDRPAE